MDSDKKNDENSNTWLMIGVGLLVLFILVVLLYNWVEMESQIDIKPSNFGFSLEDAFNVMK